MRFPPPQQILGALAPWQADILTGLRFVHFIALALGLGLATFLDLLLLRLFVAGQVTAERVEIFDMAAKTIAAALALLWLSGLGFLLHYACLCPEKLLNPKVHAKLVIVAILTLNGVVLHHVVQPLLHRQMGRPLFAGLTPAQRRLCILTGSISAVSWYVPVALGSFHQLNFSVPATGILLVYAALIALAALISHRLLQILQPSDKQR